MKELFAIDLKDYRSDATVMRRPSVRGVIVKNNKIALVYSVREKYYKFPGGGIEDGEDMPAALAREVREEVGLLVKPESISEFGSVIRRQKSNVLENTVFEQENFYFWCDCEEGVVEQDLDDYEKRAEFTLRYVDIDEAIRVNSEYTSEDSFNVIMIQREKKVLELVEARLIKKPARLKKGDKVAIVSLSWGGLGDAPLIHKYHIARERLEKDFGLQVVVMPNALKGSEFVYNNPELRAKDLMDAFADPSIQGIFCAIGGDDSIRLLPYIDYEIIRNNPKVFMGYSDTTVTHFMMHKAGVASYYGPSVMAEFGEYGRMFDYTENAVRKLLFEDSKDYEIPSCDYWCDDYILWAEENMHLSKKTQPEEHHYEVLSGSGIITGEVMGGCLDVFPMIVGTEIWPSREEWKGKILLVETSEERPSPDLVTYYLRNLGAQGILNEIKGIIVGKPQGEQYYEEYKEAYHKILKEFHCESLPIVYNVNVGHAAPCGLMPLLIKCEINLETRTIRLLESATA